MPTNLDRVQCLLQPDTFASVRTLATENRRSNSAICAELIEDALKLPKWKQQIDEAMIQVPSREDPRQAIPQTQLRSRWKKGQEPIEVVERDWTQEEKSQMGRLMAELLPPLVESGRGHVPMDQKLALMRLFNAGTITEEQMKEGWAAPAEDTPDDTENEALRQQVKDQGAMLSKMQAMLEKLTGGGEKT